MFLAGSNQPLHAGDVRRFTVSPQSPDRADRNDKLLQTTGTRLAATAAGEMTSISSGTRQRSV
jgi:hypothetical protein